MTVWAIKNDRAGNIWIATQNGLIKFREEKFVARYTIADGLPDNDVKLHPLSPVTHV